MDINGSATLVGTNEIKTVGSGEATQKLTKNIAQFVYIQGRSLLVEEKRKGEKTLLFLPGIKETDADVKIALKEKFPLASFVFGNKIGEFSDENNEEIVHSKVYEIRKCSNFNFGKKLKLINLLEIKSKKFIKSAILREVLRKI